MGVFEEGCPGGFGGLKEGHMAEVEGARERCGRRGQHGVGVPLLAMQGP